MRVFIVDDDRDFVDGLKRELDEYFYVETAYSADEARDILNSYNFDIVLLDIRLNEEKKDKDGIEILKEIKLKNPDLPVIIMTAYSDVDVAVESLKHGADDFIQKKKVSLDDYRLILKNIIEKGKLKKKVIGLEKKLERFEPTEIIGEDPKIREVRKLIKLVAEDGRVNVLIRGETGTGKELVARAIHKEGIRREAPYIVVALASLNKETIGSDLFGHEKGAYTGADSRRIGFIEEADGGVIFLDEIGELPSEIQIKLLRVLETNEFTRLGGNKKIKVDVQWIMATHRNLEEMVEKGEFRKDLYYRIKTFEIYLPPLRERKGDIPLLTDYFIHLLREEHRYPLKGVEKKVIEIFKNYSWPGNVRELKQTLEYSLLQAKLKNEKIIKIEHLPSYIVEGKLYPEKSTIPEEIPDDIQRKLAEIELTYIERALKKTGKKTEAAKILGYKNRFALRRKVISLFKKYSELMEKFPYLSSVFSFTKRDVFYKKIENERK